jgi:type III secretion protein D
MNDSLPALRLRILTGLHAGAELSLKQGSFAIGSDATCDVVVSDWVCKRSIFTVRKDDTGATILEMDGEESKHVFKVHEPVQVGDVVIVGCAPGGATTPSDLELLKLLLVPAAPVRAQRSSGIGKWVAAGMVIGVVVLSASTLHTTRSVAATRVQGAASSPLVQVRAMLRNGGYPGVKAAVEAESVVVSGLVRSSQERQALAASLALIKGQNIIHRYAVESEIEAAIVDAVALPGIKVRHLGHGQFEIDGEIPDEARKRINLQRLKNDLGTVVTALTFKAPAEATEDDKEFRSMQSNQGFQIRLATDGVKYFNQH